MSTYGKKAVACPIPTYTYYMICIEQSFLEKAYIQVVMENRMFTH